MTIQEKYTRIRPFIRNGDLIFFHSTGFIGKVIEWGDNAYTSHVGIIFEKCGALFIEDSNSNGVQSDRLSWRIAGYKDKSDFIIVRPTSKLSDIDRALTVLLMKADGEWIQYDFWNGFKELLNRKFKLSLKIKLSNKKKICSDYVKQYSQNLNIINEEFNKLVLPFPQDYLRYRNESNTKLI